LAPAFSREWVRQVVIEDKRNEKDELEDRRTAALTAQRSLYYLLRTLNPACEPLGL